MSVDTERRSEVRFELREPLMASAEFTGTCFPAELVDLSETGAKFRLPECDMPIAINRGYETSWTVCLPSGKLTRFKAEARWFRRLSEEYVIGVRFPETLKETLLREMLQSNKMPA